MDTEIHDGSKCLINALFGRKRTKSNKTDNWNLKHKCNKSCIQTKPLDQLEEELDQKLMATKKLKANRLILQKKLDEANSQIEELQKLLKEKDAMIETLIQKNKSREPSPPEPQGDTSVAKNERPRLRRLQHRTKPKPASRVKILLKINGKTEGQRTDE